MESLIPIPRIRGADAKDTYIGQTVRIVCNVANCESYGANVVKVRSVDNVELLVSLPAGESFSSTFAQLQGKITDHHEINVQHVLPISTMDVEVYNKAMDLASVQYAQIFNSNTY